MLTWPQDIMPPTMPALQYRHEAPPRLVAEAPHPVVHTGGGYYLRLARTFPAPSFMPKLCVSSFTAHQSSINTGYRRMTGFLRSRGLRIQQSRIREAMRRVNPAGVHLRALELRTIHRQLFQVYGTLALWHIDGKHKLIRYHTLIN